jgi:hypothetical protein
LAVCAPLSRALAEATHKEPLQTSGGEKNVILLRKKAASMFPRHRLFGVEKQDDSAERSAHKSGTPDPAVMVISRAVSAGKDCCGCWAAGGSVHGTWTLTCVGLTYAIGTDRAARELVV